MTNSENSYIKIRDGPASKMGDRQVERSIEGKNTVLGHYQNMWIQNVTIQLNRLYL